MRIVKMILTASAEAEVLVAQFQTPPFWCEAARMPGFASVCQLD
jgi:hypothetical protein